MKLRIRQNQTPTNINNSDTQESLLRLVLSTTAIVSCIVVDSI